MARQPPRSDASPPYLKKALAAHDDTRGSVVTGLHARIRAVAHAWIGGIKSDTDMVDLV